MRIRNSKNKKGIVLIAGFMIMAAVVVLSSAFLVVAVTEKAMANKDYRSKQAFWLAEAGIDRGRLEPDANWLGGTTGEYYLPLYNDDAGIGQYEITKRRDADDHKKFTYDSWGYIPSKISTDKKTQQGIRVVIKFKKYNIGEFTLSAMGDLDMKNHAGIEGDVLTAGTITIGGAADIKGDKLDGRAFVATFENIFGKTAAEILALPPDNIYTDPPDNKGGVTGLTWINFEVEDTFRINNSGWAGSGILIVNRGNLEMQRGTFNGIIWVIGALKLSGRAEVNGTIFVGPDIVMEGGTPGGEHPGSFVIGDAEISGSADVAYDKTEVENALTEVGANFPTMEINEGYEIISWEEL